LKQRAGHLEPGRQLEHAGYIHGGVERSARAKDEVYLTSGRFQTAGQYFEVELAEPCPIIALAIDASGRVMDVPVSYRVSAD
jgi:hypothetical protein